jgi:hypothetical protein
MFFGLIWRATRRSRGSDMRTALKVLTAIGASGVLLTAASPSASPDASVNRFTVTVRVADHYSKNVGPLASALEIPEPTSPVSSNKGNKSGARYRTACPSVLPTDGTKVFSAW